MGHEKSLGNFPHEHTADVDLDDQHPSPHQTRHHPRHTEAIRATQGDALIYLEELTQQYQLPRKLVFAVADAESSVNPGISPQPNVYKDRKGQTHRSTDYGLMQINDKTWLGKSVKDANGHSFKITDHVKDDWRANAQAGVAILKHAYDLAALSEGPGASREDIAIATYSMYNHGQGRWHRFLEKRRDGLPKDDANRNFAVKYKQWPEK